MLKSIIETQCVQAFTKAFPEFDFSQHTIDITRSTHPRFGHYQCNSAMKLTKLLKTPPRDIATKVVAVIQEQAKNWGIEHCEIAGPGFINILLSAQCISQHCQNLSEHFKEAFVTAHPQNIIIDFSSPNTAKEMHVGHLRSTIIGDSLARLFTFLGHNVIRLNHVGDWGTAFGMLIAYIKRSAQGLLTENNADLQLLVHYYKAAKKLFDADPEFKKSAQLEVVQLQQGDQQTLLIWDRICDISRKAYQEIYDLLDIHLIERGESYYNPFLAEIISDLKNKQLITLSDGAQCMFLEGFVNREGEPLPFILQKSDGGYNYATTDMAAIRHRIIDEKAQRIIYVTDAGQATHFAMLFAAAQKAGYLDPSCVRTDHVPFGLVLGADGKKFKTRSGDTERLRDLLDSAVAKAEEILVARNNQREQPIEARALHEIATILGINAVKYADLSGNRIHDYVFSYERMLRFEGNTAAFLMYAYVRILGIKRRIHQSKIEPIALHHPCEVSLGLHLCQFAEILFSISDELMPNRLCDYLFELSEKFNAFFRDCRVEGSEEQNQRLALCELTATVLQQGLTILGLKTVPQM